MTQFKYTILGKFLIKMLPFLRSAAQETFEGMPKEDQAKLKQIALIAQIIKKGHEEKLTVEQIIQQLVLQTGLTQENIESWITEYWHQKGQDVGSLKEGILLLLADAAMRAETGRKSLWNGFVNLVSGVATNIDWEALLYGVVQFVYEAYIRGRIKV